MLKKLKKKKKTGRKWLASLGKKKQAARSTGSVTQSLSFSIRETWVDSWFHTC